MPEPRSTTGPIALAIDRVVGGNGRVVVVVGDRGGGRTRCVRAAEARARQAGLRVLTAHTGGVAVGVPFEVVTELLGELAGVPKTDQLFTGAAGEAWGLVNGHVVPGSAEERNRMIHAIQWLVRRLTDQWPVALVVDDLDVADEESVRCLEYLATRSIALPLLILVTTTTQTQGRAAEIRTNLSALPSAVVLRLGDLGPHDVAALLDERGHAVPDSAFVDACVRLTGGNPGFLGELLDEVAARGIEPRAGAVAELEALDAPSSTIRTVGARLRRLGPQAAAVADAVFVLGRDATLPRVARVADVTDDEVRVLADGLAAAALLAPGDPPRLRCPIVERALAAAPASFRRADMRSRAAELLRDESAPLQRVASHVHGAEPGSAPGAIETLMAAAREELAGGRLAEAEHHLRRVLAESTTTAIGREVRLLLVCAQVALDREGAAERFDAGLTAMEPRERAAACELLADTLLVAGRRRAAAAALGRGTEVLEDVPGAEAQRTRLVGRFASVARDLPGMAAEARAVLARHRGAVLPAPMAIAAALDAAFEGRPHEETAALGHAALDAVLRDGALPDEAARCVGVLMWCDDLAGARRAADLLVANGVADAAAIDPVRAWLAFTEGRLTEAVRLANGDGAPSRVPQVASAAVAAFALLELGDLPRAVAAVAAAGAGTEERGPDVHLLDARGWIELRSGDPAAAARTFGRAQELGRSAAMDNPAVVRAWFGSAIALQRLGRSDEARGIADEALARARAFGAPRTEAAALQTVAALATSKAEAAEQLERAVELLAGSGAELERARALLASGTLLCRENRRAVGRERLREAMDLAHRIGAVEVEHRALTELRAAGARPRRAQLRGVDALTPAERQIAEHAGRGLSNREIAAALFVTPKTVEWHMRNVFLKLGIGDRRQLGDALAERAPH